MADLVCIGEPMLELNQQAAGADGRVVYLQSYGGDTSNAAIAAARQGARVAYLTAVGADPAGDGFMALWGAEGVDVRGVRRDPGRPTAVYLVQHSASGHSFQYFRRGSAASAFGPGDLDEAVIRGARMLYASGISQGISDVAADAVFRAIAVAREAGVGVAYDTNYRARLWPAARAAAVIHAAMGMCTVALPGLEDAEALTGLRDPDAVVDFYLRLGPGVVVLKMGAAGSVVATGAGRVRVPAFPCRAVDATGAGDAFCGAFLARVLAGDGVEAAARYAGCCAALSTEGFGAVPPVPGAGRVWAALGGG